jgi:D-alanyl-D-alanine carboxypeptidase
MIPTVEDPGVWAKTLVTGDLLAPQTHAERLDIPLKDGIGYGIGIFESYGWLGHYGSIPGYQGVRLYLQDADTALSSC